MIIMPVETWSTYKTLIATKLLRMQYQETSERYEIYAAEMPFVWAISLLKDGGADVLDWEASHKPGANKSLEPRDPVLSRTIHSLSAFAVNTDYEVKATGFTGTAAAGVTTTIDYAVGGEDRYINGLELFCDTAAMGDTMDLLVVDKDGVLEGLAYPPGTPLPVTLRQFGSTWNIAPDRIGQGQVVFNYVARLIAGLYVRIRYNSVGGSAVKVACNLLLHKKVS